GTTRRSHPRPGRVAGSLKPVRQPQRSTMQLLRSMLFTGFFLLFTICYAVLFVIVGPVLSWRARFAMARFWGRTLLGALRLLCGLGYRVEGAHHLPADAACIVLMKHNSTWETVAQ